jgi:hypothetical protein
MSNVFLRFRQPVLARNILASALGWIRFPMMNDPKESGVSPVPRQPPWGKAECRM